MKLYKIEGKNWETFFGKYQIDVPPKYTDIMAVAQTPKCDAWLLLSNTTYDDPSLELLDTVPPGFVFTYCQEWGLEVNDAVIDRVIADIPSRYPEIVA
tara:strand:+ start:580 stop:873 length:294 start_codon:yes stop_codon:yes gene_type:complete